MFFLVRHPASWLLSLFKNPYHMLGKRPKRLADFLDFEWKTVDRERLNQATFKPLSPYERKIKSYFAFCALLDEIDISFTFLKFEDLVLNQGEVYKGIAARLCEPRRNFKELENSTKSPTKSLDHYKTYYGKEK